MKYQVPFYANTRDDTHCVQAVFRMTLKHFLPKKNFSWKKLDLISKKEKDLGTWLVPALIWFAKNRFDLMNVERFDYRKFYNDGASYVRKSFSEQAAKWYLEKSNLRDIRRYIPEFLRRIKTQSRYARIGELQQLLDKGYLVASDVNSAVLNNRKGYDSHLVLVIGYGKDYFILHDPGLPPRENRRVTSKLFQKAWSKKYGSGPNLTALRLKK